MASLKEKIEKVFIDSACCIADPVLELEETPAHKLSGFIVSKTFLDMDQLDRQNKIWDYLERGRNNFPNYALQLQASFARSQITKISK